MNKAEKFFWPIRVYYEDTDSGGVVYHANYLKFMERARSEWFRKLGFELDQLKQEYGILLVVTALSISFTRPAKFNNEIVVSVEATEIGKASMSFKQDIIDKNNDGDKNKQIMCSAKVKIACLDANAFKPKPIPKKVLEEIKHGRISNS